VVVVINSTLMRRSSMMMARMAAMIRLMNAIRFIPLALIAAAE
jgi:hypothetical protein